MNPSRGVDVLGWTGILGSVAAEPAPTPWAEMRARPLAARKACTRVASHNRVEGSAVTAWASVPRPFDAGDSTVALLTGQ